MTDTARNEFVGTVRARSDILNVVSGYVALKHKHGNYWGCCPFHNEKTASFSVSPDKGFFYCFGCHVGGDVFKFISLIENINYFEAVKLQAERLGIALPKGKATPAEIERDKHLKDLRRVHDLAQTFFHNCLTQTGYGEPARAYLAKRGISTDTIEDFRLGFAPNAWHKLSAAFKQRGIAEDLLVAASLATEQKNGRGVYDRFRGRLMIPIADEQGRVIAFGGRVLDDSTPKYLNSAETEIFHKGRMLFGLDRAKRAIAQADYVILVEGYMDVISLHSAGIKNVVASLGTAFTSDQLRLLLRYTNNLCFCYDSDAAGQKATMRALSIIKGTNANAGIIVVPDGKDPDEFVHKQGAAAFEELARKPQPIAEYRLQYVLKQKNYDTLAGKLSILEDMLPVLGSMSKQAQQEAYIKKTANILMLEESAIRDELKRYLASPHPIERSAVQVRTQTKAVRRADSIADKAGRAVIRAAWRDPSVISHLKLVLPLAGIYEPNQQRIISLMYDLTEGIHPEKIMPNLDEAAAQELSYALLEKSEETAESYHDAVMILRQTYLNREYMEHSQRAAACLQTGDNNSYLQELSEVKRIKDEMDNLVGE